MQVSWVSPSRCIQGIAAFRKTVQVHAVARVLSRSELRLGYQIADHLAHMIRV